MSITQVLDQLPAVRYESADQDFARSSVIPNRTYRVGE
jgi:hypothetical protein